MARQIINMARALRPRVTERQRRVCRDLVGLGLARNAITAMMLSKDLNALTHADINVGHSVINSCIKELGYNIIDARHARSPAMARAAREVGSRHRMRFRIA